MLIDPNTTIQFLSLWVAEYAKNAGRTLLLTSDELGMIEIVLDHICAKACTKTQGIQHKNISYLYDDRPTPYLDLHYYADENNGLVIGPNTRTYGLYYRKYSKANEGLADIFPLFDVEDSEVLQMAMVIQPDLKVQLPEECAKLDFCNQAEIAYGIITNEESPHLHNHWPYFTMIQKIWIAEIHQREKKTRHKAFKQPFPALPSYLCRRPVP